MATILPPPSVPEFRAPPPPQDPGAVSTEEIAAWEIFGCEIADIATHEEQRHQTVYPPAV